MQKTEIVRQNLELLNEFMKYAFSDPDILDKIPPDAEIVILPSNVPELYAHNERLAKGLQRQKKKVVTIKMLKPEPVKPELVKI